MWLFIARNSRDDAIFIHSCRVLPTRLSPAVSFLVRNGNNAFYPSDAHAILEVEVEMSIPLDQITNMPAFSPYYPMPPARYRNARFQFVSFRAATAAIDRVLPASSPTKTACASPLASLFRGRPTMAPSTRASSW